MYNDGEKQPDKDSIEVVFRRIADTKDGRDFIRGLLEHCTVDHLSMTFPPDVGTIAFNEGRRSVGLFIKQLFGECPELYIKLLQESEE
jgi:hypothetical protein